MSDQDGFPEHDRGAVPPESASSRPSAILEGITVVDLTANIAGPCATLILADLGARVIKVEPPGGDASRDFAPKSDGISAAFAAFNRDKESIIIDAKSPAGREILNRLIRSADVLVESMRPGKAEILGLGWERVHAMNPRLISASISGFGNVGPMAGESGFDAIIQAYSGLMDLTGFPDGEPSRVGAAVVDVGSGTWCALEILSALMQRERDGLGRQVSTTMIGTAVAYLMHHLASVVVAGVVPKRLGTAQHNFAPYEAVRASDGLVMIAANSDGMWERVAEALGSPELTHDPRFATNSRRVANRRELVAELDVLLRDRTAEDTVAALRRAAVPASEIRTVEQFAKDPQLEALGLWGWTRSGLRLPRTPVADKTAEIGAVPPAGGDTVQILTEAGYDIEQISELAANGVVELEEQRVKESA